MSDGERFLAQWNALFVKKKSGQVDGTTGRERMNTQSHIRENAHTQYLIPFSMVFVCAEAELDGVLWGFVAGGCESACHSICV